MNKDLIEKKKEISHRTNIYLSEFEKYLVEKNNLNLSEFVRKVIKERYWTDNSIESQIIEKENEEEKLIERLKKVKSIINLLKADLSKQKEQNKILSGYTDKEKIYIKELVKKIKTKEIDLVSGCRDFKLKFEKILDYVKLSDICEKDQ